jgi:26S proteasome regulatory subunit N9
MRGMSLGLLKGNIDQVSGVLQVTWVQPRVLDQQQLQDVAQQLAGWAAR